MPNSLEYSWLSERRKRRRRRLTTALAALCVGAAFCGGQLAACLLGLPGRLDLAVGEALLPGYREDLAALQEENRALRAQTAALLPLARQNAALRKLLGSELWEQSFSYQPCTVTAVAAGGFTVDAVLEPGTPLVDASGRLLGCVARQDLRSAQATLLGAAGCRAACMVGGAVGTVELQNGVLWLTGLPRGCAAQAGDPVVTLASESCPAGLWVGRLQSSPVLSEDCLTACAPLEDAAALPAGTCFAVTEGAA